MDEMVTQYLTQAFAFIYVIDTSNSRGVNKNRVGIEITLSFLNFFFFKKTTFIVFTGYNFLYFKDTRVTSKQI